MNRSVKSEIATTMYSSGKSVIHSPCLADGWDYSQNKEMSTQQVASEQSEVVALVDAVLAESPAALVERCDRWGLVAALAEQGAYDVESLHSLLQNDYEAAKHACAKSVPPAFVAKLKDALEAAHEREIVLLRQTQRDAAHEDGPNFQGCLLELVKVFLVLGLPAAMASVWMLRDPVQLNQWPLVSRLLAEAAATWETFMDAMETFWSVALNQTACR